MTASSNSVADTIPDGVTDGARTGLETLWTGVEPWLPLVLIAVALLVATTMPLPGRGPGFFAGRDPWRSFKHQPRRAVMNRAGGRCEAPVVLAWGA